MSYSIQTYKAIAELAIIVSNNYKKSIKEYKETEQYKLFKKTLNKDEIKNIDICLNSNDPKGIQEECWEIFYNKGCSDDKDAEAHLERFVENLFYKINKNYL